MQVKQFTYVCFLWKLGLNDAKNESIFKWADGSDLTVTPNWKTSGAATKNRGERKDCVETTFDGKWNVNECFRLFGFICEKGKGREKKLSLLLHFRLTWFQFSKFEFYSFSWKFIISFFVLACVIDDFGNNVPNYGLRCLHPLCTIKWLLLCKTNDPICYS